MTSKKLAASLIAAAALLLTIAPSNASQTYVMPRGVELEITPESSPPYFDVTKDVYVGGFKLFPSGSRIALTAAKFVSETNPAVTPLPSTGPDGIIVIASPGPFSVDGVVSTTTRCGDNVNFVIENKQGLNVFYVVSRVPQNVHINC